jgi:hypothetical protein
MERFLWLERFRGDEFIKQKPDYRYNNPCKGKWNLFFPGHYKHGSAYFYATGNQGYDPVTRFMQLEDIYFIKAC